MTTDAIAILSAKLTSDADATLTREDKQLVLAALSSLAVSQGVIARQARLLKSYQHDVDSIDSTVAASLARFGARMDAPPPSAGYDLAKARAARETLLKEIERAESLEGAAAKILSFAATIAAIAA